MYLTADLPPVRYFMANLPSQVAAAQAISNAVCSELQLDAVKGNEKARA